jgi:hypothetical protein
MVTGRWISSAGSAAEIQRFTLLPEGFLIQLFNDAVAEALDDPKFCSLSDTVPEAKKSNIPKSTFTPAATLPYPKTSPDVEK